MKVMKLRDALATFGTDADGIREMILARLIERVEVGVGYKVTVKFKITYEQFLGTAA